MAKALLYRLFKIGRIPQSVAPVLEQEGILLLDEGIPGSTTYRNFRAPGRYSNWRRQWFTGSVVLTQARLTAFAFSGRIINVPLDDKRIQALHCSVEKSTTLCIRFDPSLFHDNWSGTIEYRFCTPQAFRFLELLEERLRQGAMGR